MTRKPRRWWEKQWGRLRVSGGRHINRQCLTLGVSVDWGTSPEIRVHLLFWEVRVLLEARETQEYPVVSSKGTWEKKWGRLCLSVFPDNQPKRLCLCLTLNWNYCPSVYLELLRWNVSLELEPRRTV